MIHSIHSEACNIANSCDIQHVTAPPDAQKNFLVVDAKTDTAAIEAAFDNFTDKRKDIAILLINQHVPFTAPISTHEDTDGMIDRREDTPQSRCLYSGIPQFTRDPVERPPIRPREGQRTEAREEAIWRVDARSDGEKITCIYIEV